MSRRLLGLCTIACAAGLTCCALLVGVERRSVAGADAGDGGDGACALDKPFGTPVLLAGINTSDGEFSATLTRDEREIFITAGTPAILMRAERASTRDAFGALAPVTELGGLPKPQMHASLSRDGLTLYITAGPPGTRRLWRASRPSPGEPFATAARVTFPNWTERDTEQVMVTDRGAVYFVVQNGPQRDIMVAPPDGDGGWVTPVNWFFNTGPQSEEAPVETPGGRRFYFAQGLSTTARQIIQVDGDDPTNYTVSGSFSWSGMESALPVWASADGCRLYVSILNGLGGAGGADIWVASRGR